MIAYLSGILKSKSADAAVVDVQGVGYESAITKRHAETLPDLGQPVELLIHTHVAEGVFALYGFSDSRERELFRRLISVSGIGPRMALQILSGLTPDALVNAIVGENLAVLTAISGVGKKTAERLVLELKDKVIKMGGSLDVSARQSSQSLSGGVSGEVISGLINLGYPKIVAERAVTSLPIVSGAALEDIMKQALTVLARV